MSGSTQDIQPFCVAAQQLDFSTWYIWQDAVKAVLNLIVPIGICYMFARRLLWVHNVFHGLIALKLIVVAVYAINTAITHTHIIIWRLVSSNPCDYVFLSNKCIIFKIIQSCCKFSMSSTLLLLLIERGLALHPKASEKFCRFVTHGFIFFELCVFMYITLEYYALDENIVVFVLHCQEETMTSIPFTSSIGTLCICIDLPSAILSLFLKFCSEYRLRRKQHTNLQLTYSTRYSLTIINAFLPVILFHTTIMVVNNVGERFTPTVMASMGNDVVAKKNFNGLANIMPYYTTVMPLLYVYALKRLRLRRNQEFNQLKEPRVNGKIVPDSEIYHNHLRDSWKL